MALRTDADYIIKKAIEAVLPDEAVVNALLNKNFDGHIHLVSIGKAAWAMAKAACDYLGSKVEDGIVITKYGHVKENLPHVKCYEAGHPVPDKNSFIATQAVIDFVSDFSKEDIVLLLISGGGSALFESPLVTAEELQDVTNQLLACGASITEINTIRKRLSAVKGGKFAIICSPAKIYSIVLSDIVGDPLDMIASGPAYPDSSKCIDALSIVKKYNLNCNDNILEKLRIETPKSLNNVETVITGSVKNLCNAACRVANDLGYRPIYLADNVECIAKDIGKYLSNISISAKDTKENLAFVLGGETTVELTGKGKGGRNQEIALTSAIDISGLQNVAIFSVGSDGTDGPTDAAGGYVDGSTQDKLLKQGIKIIDILKDNDAYNALNKVDGLIITGPTGTNVNDVSVVLIKAL